MKEYEVIKKYFENAKISTYYGSMTDLCSIIARATGVKLSVVELEQALLSEYLRAHVSFSYKKEDDTVRIAFYY